MFGLLLSFALIVVVCCSLYVVVRCVMFVVCLVLASLFVVCWDCRRSLLVRGVSFGVVACRIVGACRGLSLFVTVSCLLQCLALCC